VKPLEISETADEFASDSDEVHLVSDKFGQTEELGFRQCDLPIVRKLSAPTKLIVRFPTIAVLRASCRVDLILTMVMSVKGINDNSCRVAPGYK
jgi:hypothetical protein